MRMLKAVGVLTPPFLVKKTKMLKTREIVKNVKM